MSYSTDSGCFWGWLETESFQRLLYCLSLPKLALFRTVSEATLTNWDWFGETVCSVCFFSFFCCCSHSEMPLYAFSHFNLYCLEPKVSSDFRSIEITVDEYSWISPPYLLHRVLIAWWQFPSNLDYCHWSESAFTIGWCFHYWKICHFTVCYTFSRVLKHFMDF